MDLNVTSRHQENNMISSKIYKTGYFEDVALMRSELWTPPSHMYGKEYRFLVMHNLLRLVPEKGFCIEPVLLTRDHLEVHKK